MEHRVITLRRKLDELARLDVERRTFGSHAPHGHQHVQRPRLTAQQLSDLEANLGVELPAEVRVFLRDVHGGGTGPGYGLVIGPDLVVLPRRARPFPFDEADARRVIDARLGGSDRWASLEMPEDDAEDDDDWPPGPGFVPIAHHGCGVFDVVVTAGAQRGLVWCCDMAWCPHFDESGKQLGFLDWYESWLDRSLGALR